MSAETFTATVDVTSLPVFPAHDVDWLANTLWETTSIISEAHGFPEMGEEFQDAYALAERAAQAVEVMAPLMAAVMGEMLAHLASVGAVVLTVQHDGDEAEKHARLTAEGVVTALGSAACLAALMLSTGLLMRRQLTVAEPDVTITVPVTVTTGGAA